MSRIGRLPVDIPSGVQVDVDGFDVRVKGPKTEVMLLRLGADRGLDLGDLELGHQRTSTGAGAGPRWVSR